MKRYLIIFAMLLLAGSAWATSCPSGYSNWFPLSSLAQGSTTTNQTNFPMLFIGGSYLATTGNSGYSLNSGLDVTFCTGNNTGNLLPYELVTGTYSATTGAGEWWVQMPTVSYNTAETIYVGVGKSSANDSNAAGVWSAYLGTWHFGTSSTLTLTDSTGNHTATNHSATSVSGKINGAANFVAGSAEYIDLGNALNATGSQISVCAWINPTSFITNMRALSNLTGTAYNGYEWEWGGSSGTWLFQVGNGGTITSTPTSSALTTGSYQHVCTVQNSTGSGTQKIYTNGSNTTGTQSGTGGIGSSSVDMDLGRWSGQANYYFNGSLDEIEIYNGALSADWIKDAYNSQSSPSTFYAFGPPSITTSSLPTATLSAYTTTLVATGGVPSYTWSINGGGSLASQGAACTGLSLSSGGVISGTPTTTGTCSFTALVTDSVSQTATKPLNIVVINPPAFQTDGNCTWNSTTSCTKTLSVTAGWNAVAIVDSVESSAPVLSVTDTDGDTFTPCAGAGSPGTITGPVSNSAVSQIYVEMFCASLFTTNASEVFTFHSTVSGSGLGGVEIYSGGFPSLDTAQVNSASASSGNSYAMSSGATSTTSQPVELLVGGFGQDIAGGTPGFTHGTGWTARTAVGSAGSGIDYISMEDQNVSSTGTYTATGTSAVGDTAGYGGLIVALKYVAGTPSPSISPAAGTLNNLPSVTITGTGTLTYCVDSANTCTPGTSYSGAFTPSPSASTFYVRAINTVSSVASAVTSNQYVMQVASPVAVYNAGATTSFTESTSGASMYYNNTGGTPACPSTGTLYSGAISPSGTNAIRIIGCLTNFTASSVVTVQPDISVATDNFQSYYNSALAPGIFPNSSISESGTTVTATSSVNPQKGALFYPVSIFNSSISGYNGVWTPTAASSTTYQFTATSGIGNCSSNCGSSFSPAWAYSVYTGTAQIGPPYQLPIDCAWTNCAWEMTPNSNAGILAPQPDSIVGGSAVSLIPWGPSSSTIGNIQVVRTAEGYYINHSSGVYIHNLSGTTKQLGVAVRCDPAGSLCYTLYVTPSSGAAELDKWVSGAYSSALGSVSSGVTISDGSYLELRAEGSCVFRPLLNGLPIAGLSATYTDAGCSTSGTLQPGIVEGSTGTNVNVAPITGSSLYNWEGHNIGGTASGYTPPSVPSPTTISNAFNTSTASLPYQPWISASGANSVDTAAGWGLLTSAPIGATYALGGYSAQMEIRGIFNPNQWQLTQWATGSTFGQFDANFLILRHRMEQPGVANGGCLANSNIGQCADYVGYYIGVEPLNGDTAITSRSTACAVKLEYDCTPFIHITKITPVVSEANNNVITVAGSSYSIYAGDQTLAEYLNGYINVYCEASATAPSSWTALTSYTIGNVILDSNGNYELATTNGTTLTSHPTWPTTWNSTTNYGNTVSDGTETWMYYGNRCPTSSKFTRIIHLADSDLLTGFGVPGLFEDNFHSSAGPNPVFQNWSASSLFTSAGGYPCATAGNCIDIGGGLVTSGVF